LCCGLSGGLADAHLCDRHLRHVHEDLDAVVARHRGGVDRGFQVGRRDRHSEIDASATLDGAVHRGEIRQIALYDLCAEPPKGFGARILAPNQGAHLVPPCEQKFGEVAADAAHRAGCSGHEDWAAVFMFRRHVANLWFRSNQELAVTACAGVFFLYGKLTSAGRQPGLPHEEAPDRRDAASGCARR
jgi:hypothetical protein